MERGIRGESPVPGAPAGALRKQPDSPGSESGGDLVIWGSWGTVGGAECTWKVNPIGLWMTWMACLRTCGRNL